MSADQSLHGLSNDRNFLILASTGHSASVGTATMTGWGGSGAEHNAKFIVENHAFGFLVSIQMVWVQLLDSRLYVILQ